MDLRLLEIFCAIFREQSFSRAAEKLHISQPTISGHLKKLEDCLQIRLFERLPRKIIPTPAARILYRHGEKILEQRRIALQELMAFTGRLEGPLFLASSTIPGEYLLPEILVSFQRQYAGVQVQIAISDSRRVCEQVTRGEAEIGFSGAKVDTVGLEFHLLASDQLVLVAPFESRWKDLDTITLEQLQREPLLARESGSGTRLSFENKIGFNLKQFNIKAILSSTNAVKEALKAGLGLSVLSSLAVQTELAAGLLRTIVIEDCPSMARSFYVVIGSRFTPSPIARAFRHHLAEHRQVSSLLADAC